MRRSGSSGSKRNDNGTRRSEPWKKARGKSNLPRRSPQPECGASCILPCPLLRQKSRTASPEKRTQDLLMTHAGRSSLPPKRVHHVPGMIRLQARCRAAFPNQRARVHLPRAQVQPSASSLLKTSAHALAGTAGEVPWFRSQHSVPSLPPSTRTVGHPFHRCLKCSRYPFTLPFRGCP